jgi:hypothetical protein
MIFNDYRILELNNSINYVLMKKKKNDFIYLVNQQEVHSAL